MKNMFFIVAIFCFCLLAVGCSTIQSTQPAHTPHDIIQAEFAAKDQESQAFIVMTLEVFQPDFITLIEAKKSDPLVVIVKGQRSPIECTAKSMLKFGYATNVKIVE